MKVQKMSLANIQGKLSRTEMKNIMAGSGSGDGGGCSSHGCSGGCSANGHSGKCYSYNSGCYCIAGY